MKTHIKIIAIILCVFALLHGSCTQKGTKPQPPKSVDLDCLPGSLKFIWPTEGTIVVSKYSMRHRGIDIANKIGTPIYAVADGLVTFSGVLKGYGSTVIIKHEGNLNTFYSHNRINIVKEHETVKQGQKIAETGASGLATGPQLHFGVHCGEKSVNPMLYLPKPQ